MQVCGFVNLGKSKELPVVAGPEPHTSKNTPKPHTSKTHTPKPHTTETEPPEPHTAEQRFLSDSISVGGCPLSGAAAHLATPRVRAATLVLISCLRARGEVGSVPKTPAGGAPGSLTALHKRSPETVGRAKACRSFGRGDPRSCRAPAPRS